MKVIKKLFYSIFLCCILLTGCGEQTQKLTSDVTGSQTSLPVTQVESTALQPPGTDIPPEAEKFFLMVGRDMAFDIRAADMEEPTDRTLCYVGMQFYRGEPVLLYVKPCDIYGSRLTENGEYEKTAYPNPDCGLYAYQKDGTRTLLIPGNPLREALGIERARGEFKFYYDYNWYVDEEGNCYCFPVCPAEGSACFLKLDQTGQLCFKTAIEPGFQAEDFCCIDGEMYVVISGNVSRDDEKLTTTKLIKFDPETGTLAEKDTLRRETKYSAEYFGEGPDGIYLYSTKENGILRINPEDSSTSIFLSFAGGSRSNPAGNWIFKDFLVREDGSAGALYFERSMSQPDITARGMEEQITLVQGERSRITLRTIMADNWLKEQTAVFNQISDVYWVVLEELSTSTADDQDDYVKQTNVELAAGKGPDILCGSLIEDGVQEMLDKDMLLELSGMMEAGGVRRENFLQAAFNSWGEAGKVYGVNPSVSPVGYKVRRDLLGITDTPDIRGLMSALSDNAENAVYYARHEAGRLLGMFLEGSDDLWGTVDWERGTCDFGGELFAQILENAGRYGYDSRRRVPSIARSMRYDDIYRYDSREELAAEGMVMAGVLFDDGCHGAIDSRGTLSINAASPRKEGAWAFLSYLLEKEAQTALDYVPVNKSVLDIWLEKQLEKTADGKEAVLGGSYIDEDEIVKYNKVYTAADITDVRRTEYLEALEDVRILPCRTRPLLHIIYDEAGAYFDGTRSLKDVTEAIQNRVQLYLDEHS